MADKEKYYIAIEGQLLEVNKEIYEVYYKGKRKEQYFEQDLKIEHTKINKETGERMFQAVRILLKDCLKRKNNLRRMVIVWKMK